MQRNFFFALKIFPVYLICYYELETTWLCPQIFTAVVDFSKGIPVFHRCIPKNITCYAEFMQAFATFVNDNTVLPRVIAGVLASKEIIMGLCLLSLGKVTHVEAFIEMVN